ncbi:GIP [Symbiodinium sp. CCMP2592]|nr:GIP [Symbiodinium sp. CCMP2592]
MASHGPGGAAGSASAPRVRARSANATVTTGAAESSGSAAAAKAAPKAPSNQPTTQGDVGKGTEKGVRTFLEGAYFAMPMVAPSFVESGEKIYWLLDSGSSYHVVSQATLESGHVKVLSRQKRPKTVCQTATGDLVEVGSDTHATIEVNFLTTRHFEQRGGVLSTFACTCRLEAVVSSEIKHNLINFNLLCWRGWKPTLYRGLLTAERKEVTLLPAVFGDCTWLQSVMADSSAKLTLARLCWAVGWSVVLRQLRNADGVQLVGQSSCGSPGVQLASAKKGWTGRAEAMEISSDEEVEGPPAPKATGVSLAALSHNNRNYCEYCMVCGKHATEAHLMSDSHNHRMKSWIARNRPGLRLLPDRLSDPERIDMMIQLRMPDLAEPEIKKARELVLQLAWFSNQPAKADGSTLPPPEVDSEATAKSSNALPGIWAEPQSLHEQWSGVCFHHSRSRGVHPGGVLTGEWPRFLQLLGRKAKPAQAGRGDQQPQTPPKAVDPKGLGSMMPKTPPKTAPLEAPAEEDTEMVEETGMEQEAPSPPNVSPSVPPPAPPPPPVSAPPTYSWVPRSYPPPGAVLSSPSGESLYTRMRLGICTEAEADSWRVAAEMATEYASRPTSSPTGRALGPPLAPPPGVPPPAPPAGTWVINPQPLPPRRPSRSPTLIVSQLSKPDAMNNGLFALPTHQHAWKHSGVHASCEFCGQPCSVFSSAAVVAPLQEEDPLNQKNHNKEPDTQPDGRAGLGLAAGQGELIMSKRSGDTP